MRGAPANSNAPVMRPTDPVPAAAPSTVSTSARIVGPSDSPRPDISIPLTKEAVERAAIVPAPIDGVVTERSANVGLNVDSTTTLFTIVDLSTVWIVADLQEKDFSRVRVGTPATIITDAYPTLALNGRVNYIDPRVNAETRTARVRVEVPNANARLRFGMYAEVVVGEAASTEAPVLPQSAVQNVGDRTAVYLAKQNEPGVFVERDVRLGDTSGNRAQVQSVVQPGEMVVTDGSFFLRAERERCGRCRSTRRSMSSSLQRREARSRSHAE